MEPNGPGSAFSVLFDESPDQGEDLPAPFRQIYGPFRLPVPEGRPWVVINFVASRDGRVSFCEPGHVGGAAVSERNAHDTWLLGLLRSRADAVIIGDVTARLEPEHVWSASFACPGDADAFEKLRAAEGRSPRPVVVLLSLTGDLNTEARTLRDQDTPIVVATTEIGAAEASRRLFGRRNSEIVSFGVDHVDTRRLIEWLGREKQARHVLCEGGPRVYGSLLHDRAVDDEFLTLAPIALGCSATSGARRPSLVEGVSFQPGRAPHLAPISLRRAGDYLFLRSRITYPVDADSC